MPDLVYLLILATIAIIVIGIGYPIVKYIEYLQDERKSNRSNTNDDGEESYAGTGVGAGDYKPRASIMTPTEIKYYEDL